MLKELIRPWLQSWWFAGCTISRSAFVQRQCQLAPGAIIGDRVVLKGCNLGRNVRVGRGSVVLDSTIGDNVRIAANCRIANASIGQFSYVAENARISQAGIGAFCALGPDLLCGYGEHPMEHFSISPSFYSTAVPPAASFHHDPSFAERSPITIGSDVWLGARVFVRDGISIGHGVVAGAGAVIVHNLEPYSLAGGVPARLIRFRGSEPLRNCLLESAWWNWSEARLKKYGPALWGKTLEQPDEIAAVLREAISDNVR